VKPVPGRIEDDLGDLQKRFRIEIPISFNMIQYHSISLLSFNIIHNI